MKFELTVEQIQKLNEWDHECLEYTGVIGGKYTYEFTPVSLGTCVAVKCVCGKELDLTDHDDW